MDEKDEEITLSPDGFPVEEKNWPLEVRAAMYSLEVAGEADVWKNRRRLPRHLCRVEGTVVSSDDPVALADAIIYLRDVNARFIGFISSAPLRKGDIYWLHCNRAGLMIHAQIRIIRCNSFMDDWFDCGAAFLEDQPVFGLRAA